MSILHLVYRVSVKFTKQSFLIMYNAVIKYKSSVLSSLRTDFLSIIDRFIFPVFNSWFLIYKKLQEMMKYFKDAFKCWLQFPIYHCLYSFIPMFVFLLRQLTSFTFSVVFMNEFCFERAIAVVVELYLARVAFIRKSIPLMTKRILTKIQMCWRLAVSWSSESIGC